MGLFVYRLIRLWVDLQPSTFNLQLLICHGGQALEPSTFNLDWYMRLFVYAFIRSQLDFQHSTFNFPHS